MNFRMSSRFISGTSSAALCILITLLPGPKLGAADKAGIPAKKGAPDKAAEGALMQQWFSADGRSLQAQWMKLEADMVTLKLGNGSLVQVPLEKLSAQSQAAARFAARFGGRDPVYHWTFYAGNAAKRGSADGPLKDAMFNHPAGMAFDAAGNLFVADVENQTIRKITPEGNVSTFAGKAGVSGSKNGPKEEARFYHPCDLIVDDAGNLWVLEAVSSCIRKITPEGMVSRVAGNGKEVSYGHEDGRGDEARFFFPWAMAMDPAGNLIVTDGDNATIRKVTTNGLVTTLAGKARDQKFFADGKGDQARFASPRGLVIAPDGHLYVADRANEVIRKITPSGVVSVFAGKAGEAGRTDGTLSEARFSSPSGLALDAAGNLYVADRDNSTVRRISPSGLVSTIGGMPGMLAKKEGAGSEARFVNPNRIAIDGEGRLYVTDLDLRLIYRGVPQ